ncbi:restriction endonuclease subunit S [Thioalkalivibrio sp. ALJ24]|uniref:restriction endonuclease subunit S n=1 Tax=Thioalkalivibrio sp. ALJ24 TaxID=545276 RepID=UPI000372C8A2|nr:restriction endonuclease subunit S [Thioalkalivibrio sp. ALJ24]
MSFPKYPEYKDSGVEWLGEVPAHWNKTALKFLGDYFNGYPFKPEDRGEEGLPIIRIAQLTGESEPALFFGHIDERNKVNDGDLLFSWSATIDAFIWYGGDAWLNQHIFKVTPSREAVKKFLYYVIKHVAPRLADFDAHGSTMKHIKRESLAQRVYVPCLHEQVVIAAFLDHETGKIDALIEEQRRLIELLKEKRQAVISHAVTKGLDPNVPMKDSGVEWLGEVPAHWEVVKFSRVVQISEGQVDPKQEPYREMVLVAPNHVESNTGRLIAQESAESQGAESGKYLCCPGDVVYSKIRPALRKACLADKPCLCSADMYPLRARHSLDNCFLLWTILSEPFSRFAVMESQRVAMPKINRESLNELHLLLPPPEEQREIVAQIDKEIQTIDRLLQEGESAVRILDERRSALISAAVTGKIDVRDWGGGAETDEPELAMVAEESAGYSALGGAQ